MGALNVGTSPEYKLVVIGPRKVGKSGAVLYALKMKCVTHKLCIN